MRQLIFQHHGNHFEQILLLRPRIQIHRNRRLQGFIKCIVHQLIALIAPRAVHVASAEDDRWADPRGEFLSARHAGPVYALLGRRGLGIDGMPAVHQPVIGDGVAYHIRAGKHDITPYDWARYLDHADRVLRR